MKLLNFAFEFLDLLLILQNFLFGFELLIVNLFGLAFIGQVLFIGSACVLQKICDKRKHSVVKEPYLG